MTTPRSTLPQLPLPDEPARWFAFRTMYKREKMVGRRLTAGGVETYVPIKTEVRHYKTKTRTVELPLFSSYVFARITGAEYGQVLRDPDVFEIVRFNGEVGRVTDEEIAFLKLVLRESDEHFDPQLVEGMAIGTPVVISGGTLAGTRGVIMAEKSNSNFVVELRTLGVSLGITVEARYLAADTSVLRVPKSVDPPA